MEYVTLEPGWLAAETASTRLEVQSWPESFRRSHDDARTDPPCPCGGQTEYFGEALMGSLKCTTCGAELIGVGVEFIQSIRERWIRGERNQITEV